MKPMVDESCRSTSPKNTLRTLVTLGATALAVALAVSGCGESTGLVGGACRFPYVECSLACVDLETDPAHCGACDVACNAGVACVGGKCDGPSTASHDAGVDREAGVDGAGSDGNVGDGQPSDGTVSDGPVADGTLSDGAGPDGSNVDSGGTDGARPDSATGDDGGANDGSASDGAGGSSDAGDSDAGATDASASDAPAGDACLPPYTTEAHCGDCFTQCVAPNDACKFDGTSYACAPFCLAPLSRCGDTCKDLMTDGDNCGACGRVCASNICVQGVCQGAASGDIVYIGHDYATTPLRTAQARILENAVLLSRSDPVRVLSYQRYAGAGAISRVGSILADAKTRTGRNIVVTATASDAAVAGATTANFEVVLVHDQTTAPSGALSSLGQSWASGLSAFTHVSGVLVVLDGATGASQMPQLMTQTGLLTVTSHQAAATGDLIELLSATDGVGGGVISLFAVRANSARFVSEPNGGSVNWVTRHQASGTPNVIHKIAP